MLYGFGSTDCFSGACGGFGADPATGMPAGVPPLPSSMPGLPTDLTPVSVADVEAAKAEVQKTALLYAAVALGIAVVVDLFVFRR